MRLGEHDLQRIRREILDDLYGTEQKKLDERKVVMARRNRDLWLEQYQHLLAQLPEAMVTRHTDYHLSIKYAPGSPHDNTVALEERWDYSVKDAVVNPCESNGSSHYLNAAQSPLHKDLEQETAVLCNEILKLKEERDQMNEYLISTTALYKGSLQLKKVWDASLHKFLPPEPVRVKKTKEEKSAPETPTFLKERMTTNLLEDN